MNKLDWGNLVFILGYHVILLFALPLYLTFFAPSFALLGWSFALLYLSGLAITAGYHRFFSHASYKAHPLLEVILLFFGTLATQGSALRWSYDHRLHHAFIDKEQDPYSVNKGFWFAHILWMFKKRPSIDNKVVSDLIKNPLIRFQDKYYNSLMFFTNALVTYFVGWATGDYIGAFVISWLLRTFLLHHFTWFINSLAHYWGHQNYSTEHSAVDNYIISLLTFGEGYHNYHHTFAHDYRNGIRWYHFDPTKWLIFLLSKIKLAYGLKRMNEEKIHTKMIFLHKKELLLSLSQSLIQSKDELVQKVHLQAEKLADSIAIMIKKINEYREIRKQKQFEIAKKVKLELRDLKERVKEEWRSWRQLSKEIFKLKKVA